MKELEYELIEDTDDYVLFRKGNVSIDFVKNQLNGSWSVRKYYCGRDDNSKKLRKFTESEIEAALLFCEERGME